MTPPGRFSRRRSLGGVALALMLGACGHSSPTHFFTLDPIAPAAPGPSYQGPPVRVRVVHIPPAMDRLEVVDETAAEKIQVRDLDHWAASLGLTARQALIQDMTARLPSGSVVPPDVTPPKGALELQVDILSYHVVGRTATLQAGWGLSSGGPSDPKAVSTATFEANVSGETSAGIAEGLTAILGMLSDKIVSDLASRSA